MFVNLPDLSFIILKNVRLSEVTSEIMHVCDTFMFVAEPLKL